MGDRHRYSTWKPGKTERNESQSNSIFLLWARLRKACDHICKVFVSTDDKPSKTLAEHGDKLSRLKGREKVSIFKRNYLLPKRNRHAFDFIYSYISPSHKDQFLLQMPSSNKSRWATKSGVGNHFSQRAKIFLTEGAEWTRKCSSPYRIDATTPIKNMMQKDTNNILMSM